MAVPVVGHSDGVVSLVAELQAPDSINLHRSDREFGLGVLALKCLDERHAVEDERAWQIDGVDPAAFARAIDARRARAEGMGHATKRRG